ncbi:MAG TPA: NifB/NifX family molybdenum-iron cluster-binding protein [Bacillota bacterium]|nr:NifB/NifX family molybdenum-iron cluster-binding protein [Bacillota bacterium]
MFRVAVASSDGKFVNDHFGRAHQFLIFEYIGGTYRFVEMRSNIPSCQWEKNEEDAHAQTIRNLKDCQAVLVSRIGPGALHTLASNGIRSYEIADYIEEALKRIAPE